MEKLIKQFKINNKPKLSDSIEILFDFVVVALVSLIFNGFIINDHSSVFDQKFLMVANAMLLSTHWYSFIFFRQRYEKRNSFFRISTFFSVISLATMAVGIDLMVFRENSNPIYNGGSLETYEYLRWVAPVILLIGFIASRSLLAIKYALAAIANKDNKKIIKLTIWKSVSRLIVVCLAIIHLILILIGFSISTTTYIFFPLYLAIELIGNLINVKDKNIDGVPKVSLLYARQRYSKLTLLYIASFFISGSIQFAYYFKDSNDLYMLLRLFIVYLISFLIWWTYMDRVHRFAIKQKAFDLKLIAITNIFLVGSLAIIGGLLINANKDSNLNIIIPSVFIATSVFLSVLIINTKTFIKGNVSNGMSTKMKFLYIIQVAPIILELFIMGIVSIYFPFSIWVLTGNLLGVFFILNCLSRYTINKYIKAEITQ